MTSRVPDLPRRGQDVPEYRSRTTFIATAMVLFFCFFVLAAFFARHGSFCAARHHPNEIAMIGGGE